MPASMPPPAVLLPGTGSDACFIRKAFASSLVGTHFQGTWVEPNPGDLIDGYRRALDAAAGPTTIVGGVSIGAAVAVRWAADHPGGCAAVIAALPAWTGSAETAPAAISALVTADMLREIGLDRSIARMVAGSPPWLATELARSWRAQWPDLPAALEAAATYTGPTTDELRAVSVPVAVVATSDDPVHPLAVARQWHSQLPAADLSTLTLDQLGAQPARLGRLAMTALRRLGVSVG